MINPIVVEEFAKTRGVLPHEAGRCVDSNPIKRVQYWISYDLIRSCSAFFRQEQLKATQQKFILEEVFKIYDDFFNIDDYQGDKKKFEHRFSFPIWELNNPLDPNHLKMAQVIERRLEYATDICFRYVSRSYLVSPLFEKLICNFMLRLKAETFFLENVKKIKNKTSVLLDISGFVGAFENEFLSPSEAKAVSKNLFSKHGFPTLRGVDMILEHASNRFQAAWIDFNIDKNALAENLES